MDNHILFFIIAGVLIALLIGFSLWSARREKSQIFSNTFSTRPPSTPINNELNIQVPPTIAQPEQHPQPVQPHLETVENLAQIDREEIEKDVQNIRITLSDQLTADAQPSFATPISEPTTIEAESYVNTPTVSLDSATPTESADSTLSQVETEQTQTNIVTLYVVAAEGQQFRGDHIAQQLAALGFEFGEYQIFHRHLNDSTSPVLFSAANMMQPGIFDLNNLDQFYTIGLVFFMQLPSVGNDVVNLRLMIRSVESFAQAMGGFVLNDQQQLFDDQSRQDYLLRVSQQ